MMKSNPKEFKIVAFRDDQVPNVVKLRTESPPSVRTLRIEADGDFWKGLIKPKIRLTGRWLERAGFKPGNHVRVTHLAPGVMELRSLDTLMVDETKQAPSEQHNRSP